MKTLILLLVLASPVSADTDWTHKSAEGQDGGVAGDYVFYLATMSKSGDHIMGLSKVRAVYAFNHPHEEIVIAEYNYESGLHVTITKAKSEDILKLSQGKDVKAKVIREYTLEFEGERGAMPKLKITKPLTVQQQNDLYNLSVLMMLERWPINSNESGPRE